MGVGVSVERRVVEAGAVRMTVGVLWRDGVLERDRPQELCRVLPVERVGVWDLRERRLVDVGAAERVVDDVPPPRFATSAAPSELSATFPPPMALAATSPFFTWPFPRGERLQRPKPVLAGRCARAQVPSVRGSRRTPGKPMSHPSGAPR